MLWLQAFAVGVLTPALVAGAIGEDREVPGRYALLRQGRLQRNRETAAQISGGEFRYASDLVAFIRRETGERFHVEVAAYPEMHPQARSPQADSAPEPGP